MSKLNLGRISTENIGETVICHVDYRSLRAE